MLTRTNKIYMAAPGFNFKEIEIMEGEEPKILTIKDITDLEPGTSRFIQPVTFTFKRKLKNRKQRKKYKMFMRKLMKDFVK